MTEKTPTPIPILVSVGKKPNPISILIELSRK